MVSNAHATISSADQYTVRATLRRHDVAEISSKEIYAHLVVFDCEHEELRYPIEPSIGNIPLNRFSLVGDRIANSDDDFVEMSGNIPRAVLDRIHRACVKFDGGSYLGTELRSNIVSLRLPQSSRRPAPLPQGDAGDAATR